MVESTRLVSEGLSVILASVKGWGAEVRLQWGGGWVIFMEPKNLDKDFWYWGETDDNDLKGSQSGFDLGRQKHAWK